MVERIHATGSEHGCKGLIQFFPGAKRISLTHTVVSLWLSVVRSFVSGTDGKVYAQREREFYTDG
jgi:hypothetical protein